MVILWDQQPWHLCHVTSAKTHFPINKTLYCPMIIRQNHINNHIFYTPYFIFLLLAVKVQSLWYISLHLFEVLWMHQALHKMKYNRMKFGHVCITKMKQWYSTQSTFIIREKARTWYSYLSSTNEIKKKWARSCVLLLWIKMQF